MAAPRRVFEVAISEEERSELEAACPVADGVGKPGRAGAHAARLPGDVGGGTLSGTGLNSQAGNSLKETGDWRRRTRCQPR